MPPSPVPGVTLEGYPQELSVPAGRPVQVMVSGSAGDARLRVVRLLHGDSNPAGPGYRDELMDWGAPAAVTIREQVLDIGSYVEVPTTAAPALPASFTLTMWVRPTVLSTGWQAIFAKWGADAPVLGVFATGQRTLAVGLSRDGRTVEWCTGRAWLAPQQWQFLAVSYDAAEGVVQVAQSGSTGPAKSFADAPLDLTTKRLTGGGPLHQATAPWLLGALPALESVGPHWAHFNGKLARAQLIAEALGPDAIRAVRETSAFPSDHPLIAAWDFSREISTDRVVDVVGGADGIAVNMPGRGVTGPFWVGTDATMYADAPRMYDAIQLHDDDVADAGWAPAVELAVPDDAASGIYAATFERDRDRLVVPFVVTAPRLDADVCVLIPTLTWQAYSSNRGPWSYTEDGLVDATPCIYDQHRDGSMVYYVSRRRPTRSHNPAAGFPVWGAHNVTANLYLIDWLEHEGISYVLTTDEELHREGAGVFASSRCVIIGSHPEYWTGQMLEALGAHLRGGGRCLYLGGNGLFWVTSFDPARPYIIEVRKSGDWLDWWSHPTSGELAHSTTLEAGGLWSRRGRPARRLIGVEMAANCFTLPDAGRPRGYRRLPASYSPEFAFAFRGVGDDVIGNFGLNLGSAASYEMDAALELDGSEAIARTVLAEAADPAFIPLDRIPVRPRSDLVLTAYPGGGAVFAAGSVTWTGSLSHNDYANNVSLVTGNVLRHFLAVPRGQSVLGELPSEQAGTAD
jgi:N,N-dimethylformamidase